MSNRAAFRRVPVPGQVMAKLETLTLPAPTRGLILNENETFMQPGAALVMDNWKPTMQGCSIRGGYDIWAELPETTPIISGFQYASGNNHRMYVGNETKLYDVTTTTPALVQSGQGDGNYSAAQLANDGGDYLTVVNDAGDFPLQFDGTTWTQLSAGQINAAGPYSTNVATGENLVHVCKYRNRLFFVESNSMTLWYLPLNAVQGTLLPIPLSGAASRGGKLLFAARWGIDAGDGIDDKLVVATDLGELIIFTGSDPSTAATWRQEGLYEVSPPLGKNAHTLIGGDLLIMTVDGIVPTSGAITKSRAELELAAITRPIKSLWRTEVIDKREFHWSMCNWNEYGGLFITLPGGLPGQRRCLIVNAATGAWARYTNHDAMCFMRMRGDMYFGTQDGVVMQADRGGYDNGLPYVCTLVGGWEVFQSPAQTIVWRQSRAHFKARAGEPFRPQVAGCVNYIVTIPTPPSPGPDPGPLDLWDEGLWDEALWDAEGPSAPTIQNTGWVSIGLTGFSHAVVVQVSIAQVSKPVVDLISVSNTFERGAITV